MRQSVTIKDVAQRAGVSVATASRVLSGNPATSAASRDRVHRAARELDFHANARARSLRSAHADVIGVLVSDVRNPFFAQIAHGVEQAALAAGMATLLCNANESTEQQDRYLDLLMNQRVDGLIIAPQGDGSGSLGRVVQHGVPMVFVDRVIEGMDVPSITSDNVTGVDQAVQHLADAGHRRIGFVAGPQETSTGRLRLAAFRDAVARRGLTADEALVHYGDFRPESGREGADRLLDLPEPPTAVIAADSLMTIGVLQACQARGVAIGTRLSVIGYDDNETFPVLTPPLTVIAHDPAEMGTRAFGMIRDVIAGQAVGSVVLPAGLIVRHSTGSPPAPAPTTARRSTREHSGARP